MSAEAAAPPSATIARRLDTDPWLLLVAVLLVGSGLVMVLSASQAWAYLQYHFALYFFVRQVAFVAVGLVAMVVLARTDYHILRRFAAPAAALTLLLMLAVLVPGVGHTVNGARRWIGVGSLVTFQPSEVGKLVFALYLAHWVAKRGDRILSFGDGLVPFAIMMAAVLGILMLQKDLGTALITCGIFVAVYFAGGGRKRWLVLLLACLLAAFALLILVESYRSQRLAVYLDPFKDPLGTGFQSSQALIALGSGGIGGVGLGHSIQKYLWLPEAHTDFIFAIVGEETGLVGTTFLLAAFVGLAVRGYRAAMRAPDAYGVMVGAGITTWMAFQALLNMATVTDTLPITGVPLPFISYGGTSLAITMAAMGVLLNIAGQGGRHAYLRRRIDATLDIGRGDRRAPVPGARRRASVQR